MSETSRITREARPQELRALLAFVAEQCARAELAPDEALAVRVAVEEVCTNVIAHGYRDREPGPLSVEMTTCPERVTIAIEDRGVPFDPADAPAPDLVSDWETRRLGGVGWHLVKQLMDEVRHDATRDGGNRITLVKHRLVTT